MLTIHRIRQGHIEPVDDREIDPDSSDSFWLDLQDPSTADRERIERARRMHLPVITDVSEIEATSRFFVDEAGIHLRVWFLDQSKDMLVRHPVAFVLARHCLISMAWGRVAVFEALRAGHKLGHQTDSPAEVLVKLLELHLDEMADFLEAFYDEIEGHWRWEEGVTQAELENQLHDLVQMESDKHKVRFVLMDLQQALAGLRREDALPQALMPRFTALQRDLDSLLVHSDFVSEKLDFLMNMLVSRLTLIDNRVTKILSVVALVFLPPTLIGAIYGMNFQHMPELDEPWAYPVALLAMLASAVVPYLIFKWKRWL
jgi:magnesium transporter